MPESRVDDRSFAEVLTDFRRDPRSLLWQVPGIWPIAKPAGPSSGLVVVRARKELGLKKIGHAGTLDPMAEGLLVLLTAGASRLFDKMQEFPKSYTAEFRLGERTDSQDVTGKPLADWVPDRQPPLPRDEVEHVLAGFYGLINQIPPMYSALKKDGRPLYKLARKGETVERAVRTATVFALRLCGFDGNAGRLEMCVSKGFYVRTLIDDLGVALGVGAVMTGLRRTAIGPFHLDEAAAMGELAARRMFAGD